MRKGLKSILRICIMKLPEVKSGEILELLKKFDQEEHFHEFIAKRHENIQEFETALKDFFNAERSKDCAILGIDIYRYSKFGENKQNYIPFLFKFLYEKSIKDCLATQRYLFQNCTEAGVLGDLISIGDGGFQIMETPLHCLIFALYFEASLRAYNSYSYFPKLRNFIGEITVRYTISYDKLFKFENNYFGPAIINNARIISKDKLNRFLLDQNTYEWFQSKTNGIESLKIISLERLSQVSDFVSYDWNKIKDKNIIFFDKNKPSSFVSINISKLRPVEAKESLFDVYNLHLQVELTFCDTNQINNKPMVVTLGNLNTEGINI